MLLDDIGYYISASSSHGYVLGSVTAPLFRCPLPESAPDKAASIVEYAAESPERAFGDSACEPVSETPRFQVLVRDTQEHYSTARDAIESIYRALDGLGDSVINPTSSTRYYWIRALQSPFFLSYDELDRPRFVCNFSARKEQG
jgi:hypothetical protein